MSKRFAKKTIPAQPERTVEEEIGRDCDKCGRIPTPKTTIYHQKDFNVEFLEGDIYPEGGTRYGWKLEDLCDKYVAELRTLLDANGFNTKDAECEW